MKDNPFFPVLFGILQDLGILLVKMLGIIGICYLVLFIGVPSLIRYLFRSPPLPHMSQVATRQGFEMELAVSTTCVVLNDPC